MELKSRLGFSRPGVGPETLHFSQMRSLPALEAEGLDGHVGEIARLLEEVERVGLAGREQQV